MTTPDKSKEAVDRFDPSLMGTREDYADMARDPEGDYVRFTDYCALSDALTEARAEIERLRTAVYEIGKHASERARAALQQEVRKDE